MLENKIKEFLTFRSNYSGGAGYGNGYGFKEGGGYGCGCSCGKGYSSGRGYDGIDNEYHGSKHNTTDGYGNGDYFGFGLKSINGSTVYIIDNMPTIITSIRNNIAKGFIVKTDLSFEPCYIVKENNQFAHGDTLKDAFMSLQEKLYDDSTEEERIEAFKKKFPKYDDKYSNRDLFVYHHVLTGSCRMGRETFVVDKGLSLDGETSIREFVELTKDSYGGKIIKKLPVVYGME